jgi:phage shock protein A
LLSPRDAVVSSLRTQIAKAEESLPALGKKREYLERQLHDTQRQMQELRAALPV